MKVDYIRGELRPIEECKVGTAIRLLPGAVPCDEPYEDWNKNSIDFTSNSIATEAVVFIYDIASSESLTFVVATLPYVIPDEGDDEPPASWLPFGTVVEVVQEV